MFILPVNKNNEVRNLPLVVLSLVLVNTVILLATYVFSTPELVFRQYGFIPVHPSISTSLYAMFLHAGFWHLVGNMWFLWMFGNQVENMFGSWLILPVYLVCGFGGNYLHYIFNRASTIPCVGGSGAISGIAGIYFILFRRRNLTS
jgi:membrane associated rhomboid family serine protease